MISLNGVTLDSDLVWVDEFATPVIAQNIQRTVLGRLVLQQAPVVGGRKVTLSAIRSGGSFTGSFTREQIIAFRVLEQSGAVSVLIYDTQTLQVIIMAGGVQVVPLIPRPNQGVEDLYTGTLILIEV